LKHFAVAAAIVLAGCATTPEPTKPAKVRTTEAYRMLVTLTSFLPGTYDSIAQDKGPGPGIRMRVVRLWPETEQQGEFWFYFEHSRTGGDATPFEQRIYRFKADETRHHLSADAYPLPGDPKQFVGEWRKPKPFAGYRPEQMRPYPNCGMEVGAMTSMLWAHTAGTACRTGMPGAAWERTDLFASSAGMKQGSYGYDPAGRQVAGEAGPWDFRRRAELY